MCVGWGTSMTMMTQRVLIVDDDPYSAGLLRQALAQHLLPAEAVPTATQAQATLHQHGADVVLLDVALPDASGYDVCRWVRRNYADVGIVFVSGHADIAARLHAFEVGADDFLAKPVLLAELIARVRAVLRRRQSTPAHVVAASGVVLDRDTSLVALPDGRTVQLSPREAQILAVLLAHPGQLLLRADLARTVWGDEARSLPAALRLLDRHLAALRDHIEPDPVWARYVQILRGVGARFILPRR
jgi:DNA-binding response OmpR family regulator